MNRTSLLLLGSLVVAVALGSGCGEADKPVDTVAHYEKSVQANFLSSCRANASAAAASVGRTVDAATAKSFDKSCRAALLCIEKNIDIGSYTAAERAILNGQKPDPKTAAAIRSCMDDVVLANGS